MILGDTRRLHDVRECVLDSQSVTNVGVNEALLDSTGERLYIGYDSGRMRVLSPTTGRDLTSLAGHAGAIAALSLSPDGTRLASFGSDRIVLVQDTHTGETIARLSSEEATLYCLRLSRDGTLLAGGSLLDDQILVWDVRTGTLRFRMTGHKDRIIALDFSPDGRLLASASWDCTAGLWDLASGRRVATLRANLLGVNAVAFSPDGQRLAGGTGDGLIKLWNVADHQEVLSITAHRDVNQLAFLPDETLASMSIAAIQLWPAPNLDLIRRSERDQQPKVGPERKGK